MNWSGGSKNRFQSKNSNQRKASSQQQARIPFIDNDATVSLNTNNNGSSSQELKNSLFITTSCYPKPSPSNSSSLFMMTTYAKPSSVVSSNAVRINSMLNIFYMYTKIHICVQYQDTNSFMMAQKSSENPSSKFLLGNKFSNISCGSGKLSCLDSL